MALFGKRATVTLRIQGMHCANCTRTVGDALRGVPGVVLVQVDLLFHKASVTYDPERADVPALVTAVMAAGYGAEAAA